MTRDDAVQRIQSLRSGRRLDSVDEISDVLAGLEEHYLDLARRHDVLFNSAPVSVLHIDRVGRVISHNDHAAELFPAGMLPGITYMGSLLDDADRPAFIELTTACWASHETHVRDLRMLRPDSSSGFTRIAARRVCDTDTICITITNIDDLKESEGRLDAEVRRHRALLRETNHRTKNLLQIVRASLEIKARSARTKEARHIARTLRGQVTSLQGAVSALSRSGDYENADIIPLLGELVQHLSSGLGQGIRMHFTAEIPKVVMPAEAATSLSLTVSELCLNAVEHAFPDDNGGSVAVTVDGDAEEVTVSVCDDGVGFDAAATEKGSLGLVIVRDLVEGHLGGTVEWNNRNPGTEARIRIPNSHAR